MKWRMFLPQSRQAALAVVVLLLSSRAWAEDPAAGLSITLSPSQIVERMQQHNQAQAERLEHYQALRHYAVEYRGFFRKVAATMDVEVTYDASSGKSFQIVSESGSGALCQKVLKRALDSEKEASLNKEATALTEANYSFRLLGSENLNGRPAYILYVEPVAQSEFLYKGKIWVDAEDYALAKLEVQPAKNPSFWISRTSIHHTYAETDGFWLPEYNRSVTKIRIGGGAVMTIDYGIYQVVPKQAEPVLGELQHEAAKRMEPPLHADSSLYPMSR